MELQAVEVAEAGVVEVEAGSDGELPAGSELTVSFRAEVPEVLLTSMGRFIDQHPNWDQYRLFQAALAGFLVQNGLKNRNVTRCYLANLFPSQASFKAE
jgi:hypothetical protein